MSGVTVVVPSIDHAYTRVCIESMRFVDPAEVPDLREYPVSATVVTVNGTAWMNGRPDVRLVVVFNSPAHNLGVAGSWNAGVRAMYDAGHDWLAICSGAVRFGKLGGKDFLLALNLSSEVLTWPAGRPWAIEADHGLGWHLIAFHRSVFERVGYFDENFHPAYHEDNDFSYRIQLAYGIDSRSPDFVGPLWPKVPVDCTLDQVAHGIKRGGVAVNLVELQRYYVRKWGGTSTNETFKTPFDSGNPVSWCPPR